MITDYLRKLDINLEDMEWSEHVELDEIIEKLKISTITNKVTDIDDEERELNKLYSKLIEGLDEGAIENEFVSEDKSDDVVEMEFESWVKFEIEAMGVAMEQGDEGDGLQDDDQAVVMEHPVNLINPSRENCRPAKDWRLKRRRGIIPDGLVQEKLSFFKLKFPNLSGGMSSTNEIESVPGGSANSRGCKGKGVKRKAEPVHNPCKRIK